MSRFDKLMTLAFNASATEAEAIAAFQKAKRIKNSNDMTKSIHNFEGTITIATLRSGVFLFHMIKSTIQNDSKITSLVYRDTYDNRIVKLELKIQSPDEHTGKRLQKIIDMLND